MDDSEGVFENKICHFIRAKCHIKLNHAIYTKESSIFYPPSTHMYTKIENIVIMIMVSVEVKYLSGIIDGLSSCCAYYCGNLVVLRQDQVRFSCSSRQNWHEWSASCSQLDW